MLSSAEHRALRGEYRRSILLHGTPGRVDAELCDNVHHFTATILHDGETVLSAEGGGIRIPFSTCGDAAGQMRSLAGFSIASALRDVYAHTDFRQQCTHAFQLAMHGVMHARYGTRTSLYEIAVAERPDDSSTARIFRDGELLLTWELAGDNTLTAPERFAGLKTSVPAKWLIENQPELDEAPAMLHRGCVQAAAQRRVTHLSHGVAADLSRSGVCYTFQPDRAPLAQVLNSTRNFEKEGAWPLREKVAGLAAGQPYRPG